MRPRQPPRLWLMTDERLGEGLWQAIASLPRGAGIVFRHHQTPPAARRTLFRRVRRMARARGLVLVLAGTHRQASAWRADGHHGRSPGAGAGQVHTAPAHDAREIVAAARVGAALVFLSPVFPTRTHPGAETLGPVRLGLLARRSPVPVIALGGMDRRRFRRLRLLGAAGWAAIDAWAPPART